MFISEAAALSIVREMKEITGHDINIMDGTGTIFASTDPGRVGQRHEGACQILSQKLPRLTVQEDRRPGGIRPGVNLPIQLDGETVGVIGITGNPEEVDSLGAILKAHDRDHGAGRPSAGSGGSAGQRPPVLH